MSMNNNIRQWHLSSDGLKRCQVATPHEVVKLMWGLVKDRRENIESVVDLGAGDSRFASVGAYQSYTGVELDDNVESVCLRPNAEVVREDAFAWNGCDFDLAIGNPPYVKASFMAPMWRQKAQRALSKGGIDLAGNANLFLYFMALALLKTNSNGLVVQLVPYEWVARPSAGGLRSFINDHGWRVEVFRFDSSIFERVLTTACITIIDKGLTHRGGWLYNRIDPQMRVRKLRAPSVEARRVTKYSKRDQLPGVYCQRGLSPGGQDIFVLTEEERVLHSLRRNLDVVPCITSLRDWPVEQTTLNADTFEKNLVLQSRRCWLIKSTTDHPSERVLRYLGNLPPERWKMYSTCTRRDIWWKFVMPKAPIAMVASGFREQRPKMIKNQLGAIPLGGVHGLHVENPQVSIDELLCALRAHNFRQGLISHAKGLLKVEVNQMNAILQQVLRPVVGNV